MLFRSESIMEYECTREHSFDLLFLKRCRLLSIEKVQKHKCHQRDVPLSSLCREIILLNNMLYLVGGKSDSVLVLPIP